MLSVDMDNAQPFKLDPTAIEEIIARLDQEKSFLRTIPILRLKAHLRNIKVAVIGPSGGGKSTLIEALTGLANDSKSDCLPGRFEEAKRIKDFCGKGWSISDTQGFENWGADDFQFLNDILHPKDIHDTPAVVIYCHRASQRLTGFNDFISSGDRNKAVECSRAQNEAKFLKAIGESHSSLLYVVTDIYSVGDKLQSVISSTNAMMERLWNSKAVRVTPNDVDAVPTLVWNIVGTSTTVCYVNTIEKVIPDLVTSKVSTNSPVGIDDLRERLCFQAPLRAAKNYIAAIDGRPWWELVLFNGGLHALLLTVSTFTPQSSWENVILSILKDHKVASLFLAATEDRFSLIDSVVQAFQSGVASTSTLTNSMSRLLSTPAVTVEYGTLPARTSTALNPPSSPKADETKNA